MTIFLKVISGVYLALVWMAFASTFAGVHLGPSTVGETTVHVLGSVDTYHIHRMMSARVTTAR